jgi:hypothetical protein
MEATAIRASLQNFTGTTEYHRHWSGMRFTDGVRFLAEEAKAYWLLDLIASWQRDALEDRWLFEFQLWEVFVRPARTAVVVCSRDSEDEAFRQEISYTDFPLDYMKLYVERGIVLLPTEH